MTETFNIPTDQHFSAFLARAIIDDCGDFLPDLRQVHIIIPNALAISQFRQQWVQALSGACIGPQVSNLQSWLNQHLSPAESTNTAINQQARRLIMIDALNRHPHLFGNVSSWQICDSLLNLFDQLTLQQPELLDCDEADWISTLQSAYGLDSSLHRLNNEARIVHTLWQAWHQQLTAMNLSDPSQQYLQRMQQAAVTVTDQHIYIIGQDQFTGLERGFCDQLKQRNRVIEVVQDCSNEQAYPLHAIYANEHPMQQRIADFKAAYSQRQDLPRLSCFDASSAEQQALTIAAQTTFWLNCGKKNIAIISEDRKLARRVRALLERKQIIVQDTAGWSLSTTSAASCIERWLECIEEDFAYQPFIDLLKSPFFIDQEQREQHLNHVYRLEQDIIHHENIPSDLQRYRKALTQRQKRLGHWSSSTVKSLIALLDQLEQQSDALRRLYQLHQLTTAADYLQALIESLQQLGIRQRLEDDMAGLHIVSVISAMQHSLNIANPEMSWNEFRTWLASSLEQEQFTPQNSSSTVHLMNMKQAEYCHFDALIIAGANRSSLPGDVSQSAFFNQRAKQALGLKNWLDDRDAAFSLFKRFLLAADDVLITYSSEQDGEWLQPSPWVTSLLDFYKLAFGDDLQDAQLTLYFQHIEQQRRQLSPISLHRHPATSLYAELVPDEYSASRYQRLVNCPYRFFAADGLALKAEETITQELMKSDYGEKVHLILYAFHSAYPGLPAPFDAQVDKHNRAAALQHLNDLSRKVFSRDIEDNVQHRGWLNRWLQTAEAYIDWLIEHNQHWQVHQLEQALEVSLDQHTLIKGRLDRIDVQQGQYAIIDYKTGTTASQLKVDTGEDVQLVSYAKLLDDVSQVGYLKLDRGEVRMAAHLEDEQLNDIREKSLRRLQQLVSDIREGHALSAWGDAESCRHCDMAGLCRKQIWESV